MAKPSTFKIETGVPAPAHMHVKYPFGEMRVGDSFFVPMGEARRLPSAASYYGTRNGKKFTARAVDGGMRCWRVK